MIHELKEGDIIRDIEDGDCYYEGVVFLSKPTIVYTITKVVWNGLELEDDDHLIGASIEPTWWYLQVLIDGNWVNL